MKQIKLVKCRFFALVDDKNYEILSKHVWYLFRCPRLAYASTIIDGQTVLMHHLVLPTNDPKLSVDHINHNGLDNQEENLRLATHSQNLANSRKRRNTTSEYRGVQWAEHAGKWSARIQVNKKGIHLGYFKTERAAACAYNIAAKEHFGEFANLNVIPPKEAIQ